MILVTLSAGNSGNSFDWPRTVERMGVFARRELLHVGTNKTILNKSLKYTKCHPLTSCCGISYWNKIISKQLLQDCEKLSIKANFSSSSYRLIYFDCWSTHPVFSASIITGWAIMTNVLNQPIPTMWQRVMFWRKGLSINPGYGLEPSRLNHWFLANRKWYNFWQGTRLFFALYNSLQNKGVTVSFPDNEKSWRWNIDIVVLGLSPNYILRL